MSFLSDTELANIKAPTPYLLFFVLSSYSDPPFLGVPSLLCAVLAKSNDPDLLPLFRLSALVLYLR